MSDDDKINGDPPTSGSIKGAPDYYWEDLVVGDEVRGPGLTIGEAHLVTWAGLTGDQVSLHLDEEYAATTRFGTRIAHGPLTLATSLGLMTQTGYFSRVTAWLGLDEVRALQPVLIGDTIRGRATVSVSRETKKPENGLWSLDYRIYNQDDVLVMTFTSSFLIQRRPAS